MRIRGQSLELAGKVKEASRANFRGMRSLARPDGANDGSPFMTLHDTPIGLLLLFAVKFIGK
jgi:hypothetical protein